MDGQSDGKPSKDAGPPPVPLPTYLWEEIRRKKAKGTYPWTHVLKEPFDEEAWLRSMDHEYEPITPKEPPPPPVLNVTDISEVEKRPATPVPQQRYERRYIKIPNEDAIIIPLHGDSDEEINPDRYVNRELTVQEIQDRMEERFFTTPTTTEAKIEGESQAEASGSNQEAQKESQTFQTSIRHQAGRFKNKLRKISTPKISLPERPKIKLPERSKLKLPKRPTIKLPERPQIKLPDRPKIKLPEKPKFLQEKPKFLTERPKFLTERPKFLSERPKFHLPDRPKFHFPDRSKFHLPERFKSDKPKHKGPRPKKPNPSSLRRPLRDVVTVSSQSGSTGNIFDTLKFKTYPRFLSRKKKERERTQLSALGTSFETESSLPSTPPSQKKYNPPWTETFRDIKFADDDATTPEQNKDPRMEIQDEEGYEENTAPFHDSYIPDAVHLQEEPAKAKPESEGSANDSDKEIHSSGSSSMRHRAGVLEEIDSDEFFLREKGLSREDVDVSRYLSLEIRDAFRSPKNALAKLDAELYDDEYDEEEEPEIRFDEIPKAPERRKPPKPILSSKITKESDFNTFPLRPTRRKQSDPSDFGRKEVFEKIEKPPRKYRSKSDTRQGSMPSLRRSTSQGMDVDIEPPLPPKRRKGSRSLSRSIHESATDFDAADIVHREITAQGRYDIPVAPYRKSRSRGTSVAEEDRTSRGADSTDLPHDDMELQREKDIHETLFQAKPATVEDTHITGYAVVMKTRKDKAKPPPRPPPPPVRQRKHKFQTHLHNIKDRGKNFFYTYPRRAIKSLHKPPIRPIRNYSTLGPSRPPRRTRVFREPVYVDSEEPDTKEVIAISDITEDIADLKEEHEVKNLQSGEVVEKMKGRPLPPPPRPPRKSKDDDTSTKSGKKIEDDQEFIDEQLLQETLVEEWKQTSLETAPEDIKPETQEKQSYLKSKGEEFLNSLSKIYPFNSERRKSEIKKEDKSTPQPTMETSQQTSFEITEVSVSIQTDPLPEGYIVEDAHSELEAETASQRSQSTIGDQTRLDQRQLQILEKDVVEASPVSTPIQERHLTSEDSQQTTEIPSARKDISSSYESREETPPPLPQRGIPSIYPRSVPVIPVLPEKLHISELDVDKLNVAELQASKVTTQEVETASLNVTQLNSKSGNLIVNGIELPPDFIQNLAAQIQERIPESHSPQPQLKRMVTPPPSIFVQHTADVVEAPVPHTTQTTDKIPQPKNVRRRGRKSPTRVEEDSEDELATTMPERERRERENSAKREFHRQSQERVPCTSSTAEQSSVSETPVITATAMQLIAQLLVIWHRSILDGASSFMEGVNALFPEGEKRRDAQTAACILLVLIAGLILIGFGIDNTVHHHHWDYVPPR